MPEENNPKLSNKVTSDTERMNGTESDNDEMGDDEEDRVFD